MNLINCGKDCVHQKDGQCTLETVSPVSGSKVDGCCYFKPRQDPGREGRDNNIGGSFGQRKGTVI